jgi:hypothetical protein
MYSGATDYWLAWADVVDAVKGPVAGDTNFRLYFTGSAFAPRKTNLALATSAVNYPASSLEMGIPAPTVAPGLAVVGGAAANVTRTYFETFVSTAGTWDEEGPPGLPVTVTGRPDGSWNLTGLNAAPGGLYAIDRRRIYRTLTGSTGITNYQLVVELPIATTTYSDTIADSALGVICPSFTNGVSGSAWSPPPSDMHSLVNLPNDGRGVEEHPVLLGAKPAARLACHVSTGDEQHHRRAGRVRQFCGGVHQGLPRGLHRHAPGRDERRHRALPRALCVEARHCEF